MILKKLISHWHKSSRHQMQHRRVKKSGLTSPTPSLVARFLKGKFFDKLFKVMSESGGSLIGKPLQDKN